MSDILQAIQDEEQRSYGGDDILSQDRAHALDFYLGRPLGNETDGNSSIVSRDVSDVIESLMPYLMKVFYGTDTPCKFDPFGPEDVEAAEQATEYVNFIVTQKANAYEAVYSWIKDALIGRVGYIKAYWVERQEPATETYQGLSDDELAVMLQDPAIEVVGHTASTDATGQALHDVQLRSYSDASGLEITAVPGDEMRVSHRTRSLDLKKAPFIQHRTRKTISEIRQMGYDIPDDVSDDYESTDGVEAAGRDRFGESDWAYSSGEGANRLVMLRDSYLYFDADGDGIAELRHVLHIGDLVLEDEECDLIPFSAISPILMPHQHVGLSYMDLIEDLQLIKTALIRGVLDNIARINDGRWAINENTVDLDDLLTTRAGGVVRIDGNPAEGHVMPLAPPSIGQTAFPVIEYLEGVKENRTGVTRYNQGADANSLNKTASGISQIMGAAQQRMELVARTMAETGFKDLFQTVYAIILKHQHKADMIKLRGKWTAIDPREWRTKRNVTVSVGLGTGNKDQMLAHLMSFGQFADKAAQAGVIEPRNVYELGKKILENMGFKQTDDLITDPSQKQPQEPQPDPKMIEAQQKMQLEQAKLQMNMQLEREKMQQQMEIERMKLEAEYAFRREMTGTVPYA